MLRYDRLVFDDEPRPTSDVTDSIEHFIRDLLRTSKRFKWLHVTCIKEPDITLRYDVNGITRVTAQDGDVVMTDGDWVYVAPAGSSYRIRGLNDTNPGNAADRLMYVSECAIEFVTPGGWRLTIECSDHDEADDL